MKLTSSNPEVWFRRNQTAPGKAMTERRVFQTGVLLSSGYRIPECNAKRGSRRKGQLLPNEAFCRPRRIFSMYIPPAFRVEDFSKLAAFIQRHSFATLITHDGVAPFASHLPMLFRPDLGRHGTLLTHMARANPQWQHFASGGEVLAVFHGPHSYISPLWYQAELAVPTWNYAAVHAYGVPIIFDEHERVVALLRNTVAAYEASFERPWSGDLPGEFRDKLIHGIVAFEIPIDRIEGKFKLGQNRPAADIQGVFDALSRSEDADSRAVAQMMLAECNVYESAKP